LEVGETPRSGPYLNFPWGQLGSLTSVPVGTSVRLFLADGDPDGLWVVEKSNWTGVGLVVPRPIFTRVRSARQEFTRAGAYVLVGPSETNPERERVYIGEADVLRPRLDSHYANKDFWTRVVIFTTKDASLNKAHVRYLESRLVALAHQAGRAEVENSAAPALPAMAEAEVADTEGFLADMLLIYPVIGVHAFEELRTLGAGEEPLQLHGPGANAEGKQTGDGFVVLAGSLARAETVPSIHVYLKELREVLQADGVIEQTPEGLRFRRDHLFNSPSTAAGVVLGRAANGRTEWKDGNGRTLKEIQSAEVAQ
jgi:hypothetical protein